MSGSDDLEEGKQCVKKESYKSLSKTMRFKEFQREYYSPSDITELQPALEATYSGINKEMWDVARLPADVPTIPRRSKRLEKLSQEIEVSHKKAVEEMKEKMQKANCDFENTYRFNAELLKRFLQKEQVKVDDVVKETLLEPKNTIVFGDIKYCDVPAAILNYSKYCNNAIEKFHKSILCLEQQRCDSYKHIFRKSYAEVSDIAHLMPFQIQQYFELEINKFNEILLQNYRSYAEIDMILKTDIEQNKTIWHQKFNRNKAKWIEFFRTHGLNTTILEMISAVDLKSMMSFISDVVKDRYKGVLATITGMDDFVNEQLRKCKFALLKIYYGEYNELQMLDEDFLVPTDAASRDELLQFKDELNKIMHEVEVDKLLETELDDENFKEMISELKERIQQIDKFLARVANLWNEHYRRDAELHDILTHHMNKIEVEYENAIQGVEMQLSIYNDLCRSAATIEDTQTNFGYALAALNKCASIYSDQLVKEEAVLTNYLEMVEIEADILIAELDRFLDTYQPTFNFPLPKQTKQSTEDILMSEMIKDYDPIHGKFPQVDSENDIRPPHIKYISFKITSLDNWKYGIWETVEVKKRECKDEMLVNAREWMKPYKEGSELRCEQKLALNKIKYYRFWLTVYYMRFVEIQQHTDRFESHNKGIIAMLEDLQECKNKVLNEISLLVEVTAKDIVTLENEIKNAKSSAYLKSANVKMKVIKESFHKKLEQLKASFQVEKLERELVVQEANMKYLKSVLMFSESGNYHPAEVKLLSDKLQRMEKEFMNKCGSSEKEFLRDIPKISMKINATEESFRNLSCHMEGEFTFMDNVRDCMNSLQNEIKKIAYNLKYKRKVVEAYMEKVNELTRGLTARITKKGLELIATKIYRVIKNFEELYLLLQRNDEQSFLPDIRKASNIIKDTKSAKSVSVLKVASREKKAKSMENMFKVPRCPWSTVIAKQSTSALDLRTKSAESQQDIQEKEEIKEPFNDSIVNLLFDKMEHLQSIGLSFYTTVKSIVNKDKIEATFEEYSGNIMAKCAYFQIQCDAMWLEEAVEYVKLSAIFRNGILKTYGIFLRTCLEYNERKYEKRFANLKEILIDVDLGATTEVKNVHQQLKSFHGFPKNKELLKKLHDEFLKQLRRYDMRIYRSIGNFKRDHKALKEFILDKLTTFDKTFREVILNERLKNLNGDLFVQILNLFTKLQNLKSKPDNSIPSFQDPLISRIANDKLNVYKSSLTVIPIPEEFVSRFSVSNASYSIDSLSETFDFDDKVIEFVDLTEYSKKMEYILGIHLDELGEFERHVIRECEKWEAIWDNDVKIIKKIYIVKYRIPSDEPSITSID